MTIAHLPLKPLPAARGPLSDAVNDVLRRTPGSPVPPLGTSDPFGEDMHAALHTVYELHYHGHPQVDPGWEWDPCLLGLRADMERLFTDALHNGVVGGDDLDAELAGLLTPSDESTSITRFLRDEGAWWQLCEYFVHRSIYHHKEADPYAWVIPRLRGQAKASLVAVEYDEFGGGRGERVHAQLYADLLAAAGLDPGYLHYFDAVPAPMIALVNMMSLFGLHRIHRGALVGHFAAAEITSPLSSRNMVYALTRHDADPACVLFYREHVEADAVHEQIMRHDVIGDLLAREPDERAAVVFGMQTTELMEGRFSDHLRTAWNAGHSSLRDDTWHADDD
ncbi:iron-containing redox enzyme family protein [Nocardia sp. NPDC049190]|uniref:iron-containing redox enzyme family protein n=1 Tax=Nocardia sp. NPDC049190 TaxID=3155650 RepID=UPI0033D9FBED